MRSSVKTGASRLGALGFLAIALGCAALAAFTIGNSMKSSYSGTRVAPVVVATAELKAGQPLTRDVLVVREWPEDAVPAGSFATVELLLASAQHATPTVGILAGEPVVAARLSSSRQGTGIASMLSPRMRAIAVAVDDAAGYTGLLYPGAAVDILATMRDPMGRGPSSKIAVQAARVLSVGLDTDVATRRIARTEEGLDKTADRGTFVTLEVTPEDAEILAVARSEGRIDIVLRNATDDAIVETTGARPEKFSAFGPTDEAVALAAAPADGAPKGNVPTVKRKNRSIQLVASDKSDVPSKSSSTGGAIEVLNAK
ncbi:MAG: Flp pilus assembly protein CpaB [Deltaproteobacteria bacterium]|nr:Flp pilus assembly protein CpaB [Deltaproteobacteria bacterium]